MYDLAIIGAGPAGSGAAITAARAGARVLLLERGRFPRHKVCGEFVSAESLDLLCGLLAQCPESLEFLRAAPRIKTGRLFVDASVLTAPVDPPAASIPRYWLDEHLWQVAVQAGVEARQQHTVTAITGTGPFAITGAGGAFEARSIVQAAGRWSNLSRPENGRNHHGASWIGLKAHFTEANPCPSVDLYFFEGGYCGVQPVHSSSESVINVCAMVRADIASCLTEVFQRHPALRLRSRDWTPRMEPVSTAPLIFRTPEPTAENILLAGDSAGFVDPFVGDGISLALRSGVLAAKTLQPVWERRVQLSQAAASYRENYNRQFLTVFQTSSKVRRLLALPYPVRRALLRLFDSVPALTSYLVRKTR
jgi:flavin-dependent dehydrogenase